MKATEQHFPMVLFIMLYKVALTFESVNEILWCGYSNESYWAVLSCGTVYYAVQAGSNLESCGVAIHIKAIGQYSPLVLFIMLYKMVLTSQVNG